VKERAGNTLELIGIGNDFQNRTQVAQQLRESLTKGQKNCAELKGSKLKMLPTEWEKIFASYTSDKGLITRIDRELKKLNSQKIK
jgi:hypothetical protein